jgi:hypothetical protein
MVNFIHSVYRQELGLKKKKKGITSQCNGWFVTFFFIYLLIYSCIYGLFNDAIHIFD